MKRMLNDWENQGKLARPERLLAAAPLVLRFAPDRRRCAPASNLAADGQVVELALLSVGSSNRYPNRARGAPSSPQTYSWKMARPERFELPTTWFVARYSIQLSYGRAEPRSISQGSALGSIPATGSLPPLPGLAATRWLPLHQPPIEPNSTGTLT